MAITFHCQHCGKKIEAPDGSGGRWGRCPACNGKVYVPSLDEDVDDLRLAPLDEADEQKRRPMLAETFALTSQILQEKTVPIPDDQTPTQPDDSLVMPLPRMSDTELQEEIIGYLRMMADGDLEKAQLSSDIIVAHGRQAIAVLDRIALSQIPDKRLAAIPPHVMSALIRDLRTKIT
jgi:DNA-directed RNA polymerase subunit RPC12/RpoP